MRRFIDKDSIVALKTQSNVLYKRFKLIDNRTQKNILIASFTLLILVSTALIVVAQKAVEFGGHIVESYQTRNQPQKLKSNI